MKIHWQIIVVLIPTWTAANWLYATYCPTDNLPHWSLISYYQATAFVAAAIWANFVRAEAEELDRRIPKRERTG